MYLNTNDHHKNPPVNKNKPSLESIQERVQLRSRSDIEMGSTNRYLENRTAQQQYNSGETSSMDSKDYDVASNSSLALSYGNLETSKNLLIYKIK